VESKTSVVRIEPLRSQNKFKVHLECKHFMIIDATLDDPAKFGRRCEVNCLQCESSGPPQFMEGGQHG